MRLKKFNIEYGKTVFKSFSDESRIRILNILSNRKEATITDLEIILKRDEVLFKIIKKNLKRISYTNFNFKVNISKQKYVRMIKERYISCLLNMNNKEINLGISEIKSKYKNQIKFTDTLKCISYRK